MARLSDPIEQRIADAIASWHGLYDEPRPLSAYLRDVLGDLFSAPTAELQAIGELIRTQDNRYTDRPIFCVMKKRAMVVDEDYDHDRIEWADTENDYVLASEHKSRRLELLYEHGRETGRWQRNAIKDVDEFVTACFTEQGCKDFLARDGHHHRKPFICVHGSYRNAEYQAVRSYLAALPSPAEPAQ